MKSGSALVSKDQTCSDTSLRCLTGLGSAEFGSQFGRTPSQTEYTSSGMAPRIMKKRKSNPTLWFQTPPDTQKSSLSRLLGPLPLRSTVAMRYPNNCGVELDLWKCPVVSGTMELSTDPSSPEGCQVEHKWIGLVGALFHESWTSPSGVRCHWESRCHWAEDLACKAVFFFLWLFSLDIRTTSKWTVGPVAPDKELKESTWPPIMAKNSNVFTEWLFGLVGNQIKHNQHPITWLRLPQGWVRLVDSLFCTWLRLGQRNWLVCWREMKLWLVRVQAEIQMRRFGLF